MSHLLLLPSLIVGAVVTGRVWTWATDIDPLTQLTQYGPLGLMVLGFLTGWIVPGPAARAQAAEITRLQALFEKEVLPMARTYAQTMAQVTSVLERVVPVLDKAVDTVRRSP